MNKCKYKYANISFQTAVHHGLCLDFDGLTHPPPQKKRKKKNGRHFADIFKCIFMNETFWILTRTSLKFVSEGSIDSKPELVQVMAWRRPGDKPLPEHMPTLFTDAYMRH